MKKFIEEFANDIENLHRDVMFGRKYYENRMDELDRILGLPNNYEAELLYVQAIQHLKMAQISMKLAALKLVE